MSKRELIIEAIKWEFAREGKPTQAALRLYIENRISLTTYNEAARRGYAIYEQQTADKGGYNEDRK